MDNKSLIKFYENNDIQLVKEYHNKRKHIDFH